MRSSLCFHAFFPVSFETFSLVSSPLVSRKRSTIEVKFSFVGPMWMTPIYKDVLRQEVRKEVLREAARKETNRIVIAELDRQVRRRVEEGLPKFVQNDRAFKTIRDRLAEAAERDPKAQVAEWTSQTLANDNVWRSIIEKQANGTKMEVRIRALEVLTEVEMEARIRTLERCSFGLILGLTAFLLVKSGIPKE